MAGVLLCPEKSFPLAFPFNFKSIDSLACEVFNVSDLDVAIFTSWALGSSFYLFIEPINAEYSVYGNI